jgi:hypothetical protein
MTATAEGAPSKEARRKRQSLDVGYRGKVTMPGAGRGDFREATPLEVRNALIPEEQADFDRSWRKVMAEATETLDLTKVFAMLEHWRRTAWVTQAHGPDSYRQMLATAEHRLRTGERAPDAVSWTELKAELGL